MLIHRSVAFAVAVCLAAQTDEQVLKSQQAKQLMAQGQFAEAIPLYAELVRAMPTNPGLLLNLAMAEHMAGQDRAAIGHFEQVLKLEPKAFPALAMMGASWMRLGQPASAIPPLRKAAALQPKNPGVWHSLGRSYEALAQSSFESLARTAPGSAWWLALIAESRIRHKQNTSAFYFYRQALTKNPKLRGAHAALAVIYRDTGHPDWAQVEEEREKSLGDPDCKAFVAECHYRTGRYQDVVAATRLNKTAESQYWRIKAYNALAADAFNRLASLGPSIPYHQFQAEQFRAQGRHADAIQELRQALAIQPGDPALERDLATTVYLSRDYTAAEPLLRKLIEQQPDAADLRFLLGDALLNLQRVEEAIPELRNAVQRDPKLLPAHSALGRALMQTGEAQKAMPHLQAALPIDEDGSLHYQLMRAAQAGGNSTVAAQTQQKYQQIQKANEAAKKELEEQAQITAP